MMTQSENLAPIGESESCEFLQRFLSLCFRTLCFRSIPSLYWTLWCLNQLNSHAILTRKYCISPPLDDISSRQKSRLSHKNMKKVRFPLGPQFPVNFTKLS